MVKSGTIDQPGDKVVRANVFVIIPYGFTGKTFRIFSTYAIPSANVLVLKSLSLVTIVINVSMKICATIWCPCLLHPIGPKPDRTFTFSGESTQLID